MIEAISKILDALAKYSWGIVAACLFVLFFPEEQARKIGILEIRNVYQGYWWICLVFSSAILIGTLYSKLSNTITTIYRNSKENREKLAKIEEKKEIIIHRLHSLNESEQKWIAYCLMNNVQTLHATQINPTANSLTHKGIVSYGSGNIMSLAFTFVDFVWEYLQVHRDDFLPHNVENDTHALNVLQQFKKSLTEAY